MRTRKLLSVVLAFVMVLGLLPMSAMAASYSDAEGHWAEAAINRWSDYGIVTGDERGFRPNDNMTRAEAAKVLCELFGLTSTAGAASFTDVPADAWYAGYIAKANAAGILGGVGDNQAAPNAPLTRETFFVMFARGLGLKEQSTTSGVAADGSSWSTGLINALTDKGYVKGDGTGVNALANINRASVMSLLDQTVAQYVNTSGTTTLTADKGIVLVNAKNVTLTGTTNADVVIAKGASDGSVNFEKATINGAVTVQADNAKVTADKDSKLASAPVVNGAGSTYTATKQATVVSGGGVGPSSSGTTENVVASIVSDGLVTGKTFDGDVKITSAVGNGDVTITSTTINGDLIVEGGGSNSITLGTGAVITGKVIMNKISGGTAQVPSLKVAGDASITEGVVVKKEAAVDVTTSAASKPAIEAQADVAITGSAATGAVTVTAANVTVDVSGSASPASVTVDSAGVNTTISVASDATVSTVTTKANVTIDNADADATAVTVSADAPSAVTVTAAGNAAVNVTANAETTVDSTGNGSVGTVTAAAPVTAKTDVTSVSVTSTAAKPVTVTVDSGATVGTVTATAGNTAATTIAGSGTVTNVAASADVTVAGAAVETLTVDSNSNAVTVKANSGTIDAVTVAGSSDNAVVITSDTGAANAVGTVSVATTDATVSVNSAAVDNVKVTATSGTAQVAVTGSGSVKVDADTAGSSTVNLTGATDNVTVTTATADANTAAAKVTVGGSAIDSSAVATKSTAPSVSYDQNSGAVTISDLSSLSGTLAVYDSATGTGTIALASGALTVTGGSATLSLDTTEVKDNFFITFTESGKLESDRTKFNFTPLAFAYNSSNHDVAGGTTGGTFTDKDFASTGHATNGSGAISYAISDGPAWLRIVDGHTLTVIESLSGKYPATASEATTAVVTATDAAGVSKSITINVGAVTLPASNGPTSVSMSGNKTLTVTLTAGAGGTLNVYKSNTATAPIATKTIGANASSGDVEITLTDYATDNVYVSYTETGKSESGRTASTNYAQPTVAVAYPSGVSTTALVRGASATFTLEATLTGAAFADSLSAADFTFAAIENLSVTNDKAAASVTRVSESKATVTLPVTALKAATSGNASVTLTVGAGALKGAFTATSNSELLTNIVTEATNIAFTAANPDGTFFKNSEKWYDATTGAENAYVNSANSGFITITSGEEAATASANVLSERSANAKVTLESNVAQYAFSEAAATGTTVKVLGEITALAGITTKEALVNYLAENGGTVTYSAVKAGGVIFVTAYEPDSASPSVVAATVGDISGAYASNSNLYSRYSVAASEADGDGYIPVTITAQGLKYHLNADVVNHFGYWAGVGVTAPTDATGVLYNWGATPVAKPTKANGNSLTTLDVAVDNAHASDESDSYKGFAAYLDASDLTQTKYLTLTWLKDGVVFGGTTTYKVSFSSDSSVDESSALVTVAKSGSAPSTVTHIGAQSTDKFVLATADQSKPAGKYFFNNTSTKNSSGKWELTLTEALSVDDVTVTFDPADGTLASPDANVTTKTVAVNTSTGTVEAPDNPTPPTGASFDGWFDASGKQWSSTSIYTASTTLTAKYTAGGISASAVRTTTYDASAEATNVTTVVTITGWSEADTSSYYYISGTEAPEHVYGSARGAHTMLANLEKDGENGTFTAAVAANATHVYIVSVVDGKIVKQGAAEIEESGVYPITYHLPEGAVNPNTSKTTYTKGTNPNIEAPTLTNFTGTWYTDATLTREYSWTGNETGTLALYAGFAPTAQPSFIALSNVTTKATGHDQATDIGELTFTLNDGVYKLTKATENLELSTAAVAGIPAGSHVVGFGIKLPVGSETYPESARLVIYGTSANVYAPLSGAFTNGKAENGAENGQTDVYLRVDDVMAQANASQKFLIVFDWDGTQWDATEKAVKIFESGIKPTVYELTITGTTMLAPTLSNDITITPATGAVTAPAAEHGGTVSCYVAANNAVATWTVGMAVPEAFTDAVTTVDALDNGKTLYAVEVKESKVVAYKTLAISGLAIVNKAEVNGSDLSTAITNASTGGLTVISDLTVSNAVTIGGSEKLTIADGASLAVGNTLTVEGTLELEGTGTLGTTESGKVVVSDTGTISAPRDTIAEAMTSIMLEINAGGKIYVSSGAAGTPYYIVGTFDDEQEANAQGIDDCFLSLDENCTLTVDGDGNVALAVAENEESGTASIPAGLAWSATWDGAEFYAISIGRGVTLTVKGTLQVDGTATATEDTGKIVVDETGVLVVENYDTNRDATVTVKAGGKLYVTDVSEEVPFFGTNETNASAGTELTAGSVTITFDADDNETVKFDDSSTNAVIYTWPDGWTAKNKDDNVIELGDLDAPVTITGGVVPEPDPDSEP